MKIEYLHRKDIDRILWDQCVSASTANLIYGHSAFLDTMIPNWDAIVVNNYEAVIPLPFRTKWGIRYIYDPAFTQQLGLFSINENIRFEHVLPTVQQHFKYADIFLNFSNSVEGMLAKTNLVLSLNKSYKELYDSYKTDLKKNLKKVDKETWSYAVEFLPTEAVDMHRKHYFRKIGNASYKDFDNICLLAKKLYLQGMAFTRSISDKGKILSIALFLFDGRRIYNVMNTTTADGKEREANHFLLDRVVHEFAGKNYIFDFEGSDEPGIKAFYEKFRPQNQPYFYYKFNTLPDILKIVKK